VDNSASGGDGVIVDRCAPTQRPTALLRTGFGRETTHVDKYTMTASIVGGEAELDAAHAFVCHWTIRDSPLRPSVASGAKTERLIQILSQAYHLSVIVIVRS
jgi:hypothetical protein